MTHHNRILPFSMAVLAGMLCSNAPSRAHAREDARQLYIKKYDANGDGRIDGAEREKLCKDALEGRLPLSKEVRDRLKQKGWPNVSTAGNLDIQRNVQYGDAGNRPLRLDILRPKSSHEKPLPAIVFIHGGAWRGGNKNVGFRKLVPFAASGNYFCASIEYRLSGESTWPAQIHDCKAAIRWLKANAKKYGIDPQRIGVWGVSAGGHLVSLLGTSGGVEDLEGDCGSADASSRVACVVDFCGPSDLVKIIGKKHSASTSGPVQQFLGGSIDANRDAAIAASPATHVTRDDPPFLIVQGTNDPLVPLDQAELLHAKLDKAGVDSTLVKIEGGGHGIGGAEVLRRVTDFFDKHLRGKDVKVSGEPIQGGRRR